MEILGEKIAAAIVRAKNRLAEVEALHFASMERKYTDATRLGMLREADRDLVKMLADADISKVLEAMQWDYKRN
jgi:hypothetical protein